MPANLTRRAMVAASALVALTACTGSHSSRGSGETGSDQESRERSCEESETTPAEEAKDPVDEIISSLTTKQKVALLFVARPEGVTGASPQTMAGEATREALESSCPAGVCWMGANLQSPDQTREMLANYSAYALEANGLAYLHAVDEEGGIVARVASNSAFGITDVGSMQDIGATGDPQKAEEAASYVGSYLADLGFNLDFAPVCDVVSSTANAALARRSFGSDPDLVAQMVAAQVSGYTEAGVLCCAKHFPGIGYAQGDSEYEAIYSTRTLDEMRSCELVPFQAAIDAGVPMVMIGHLVCSGVSESGLPASLDGTIVQGLLRDELGFDGVVITDALGMGALTNVADFDQLPLLAFEAGCDLLLMPVDYQASLQVMLDAVSEGRIGESRLDESLRRIVSLKLSL